MTEDQDDRPTSGKGSPSPLGGIRRASLRLSEAELAWTGAATPEESAAADLRHSVDLS